MSSPVGGLKPQIRGGRRQCYSAGGGIQRRAVDRAPLTLVAMTAAVAEAVVAGGIEDDQQLVRRNRIWTSDRERVDAGNHYGYCIGILLEPQEELTFDAKPRRAIAEALFGTTEYVVPASLVPSSLRAL
jgi:hypothetical protein